MAAIAAITVTVHKKLSRVWPRVEFPSDFLNEGLVDRNTGEERLRVRHQLMDRRD